MIQLKSFAVAVAVVCLGHLTSRDAAAQRQYMGSTPADSQYYGASGADPNGRVVNAEGRSVDRFGNYVDDYGWKSWTYRAPSHAAMGYGSSGSSTGGYSPGGYGGLSYTNGIGYSVGVGAYSGGYSPAPSSIGAPGGRPAIAPPRTIVVGGAYPSRTVMNNATRGTVIEYTQNGRGSISTPGSSYQTVVSSGPSIFPSTTVIQPSQPPVVIESRPTRSVSKTFSGSTPVQTSTVPRTADIHLACPKNAGAPLSYVLNGTTYEIKPGYTHSFPDDRPWTLEFLRGGNGSPPMRYELKAGIYQFSPDENGWDLKQYPPPAVREQRPAAPPELPVAAPVPSPDF